MPEISEPRNRVKWKPTPDKILERIEVDDAGCWIWKGITQPNGYGYCSIGKRHFRTAHRVSYQIFVGPIPAGLEIDHLCRVKLCVNPEHLEAVTHAENVRRGDSPAAVNARKTHCVRGHPLSGENLLTRYGRRYCLACRHQRKPS